MESIIPTATLECVDHMCTRRITVFRSQATWGRGFFASVTLCDRRACSVSVAVGIVAVETAPHRGIAFWGLVRQRCLYQFSCRKGHVVGVGLRLEIDFVPGLNNLSLRAGEPYLGMWRENIGNGFLGSSHGITPRCRR